MGISKRQEQRSEKASQLKKTTSDKKYTYHLKKDDKIVHSGITNNLERREQEHRQRWKEASIEQVGNIKTLPKALEWEKSQDKSITPDPRK